MPSLKMAHALLAPETQNALSLPMAALMLGVVSQVDSLIELADRVCGPVFQRGVKTTTDSVVGSTGPGREGH